MKCIRHELRAGNPCIGSWIQIAHPTAAELMCGYGLDWIALDCEHAAFNPETLSQIINVLAAGDTVPMVRVQENAAMPIRHALDFGARGVIVPLVNSAEDALNAVRYAKYPPAGIRGYAFCRANNHGTDFDVYVKAANEEICVFVMIETKQAVDSIEEILGVAGVDGIVLGVYDLSGSYGVPGQLDHPDVADGVQKVLTACLQSGKAAGIHVVHPAPGQLSELISQGFRFIALGMDTTFLQSGAESVLKAEGRETE